MPRPTDSGFDVVASFYDPLARLVYGRALQRAQEAALDAGLTSGRPRVLIIGGGTGWVLGQVLKRQPKARVVYVEASGRMLARSEAWARRHLPQHLGQIEFRLGTEACLPPTACFEAVVTFFFLDLFTPVRLRSITARVGAVLVPGGRWLLADFARPRSWWQHTLLKLMYWFFGFTTGISARHRPPIEDELAQLGLSPQLAGQFFGGMVEASVWQ
ncbi:class I SAM-dependent methyltransferase [Hymenobacter sp. 5516J-16]|uniref:class I SAM-dependent methyltransferase n=1 Tax=Hymenobacter sp. 5516J-16 TaxID=2932253 RepID=UPI001FD0AF22|nr:class I SAM-dependent methyltransferase [Hymenobacter sp. 5516J-16]UOQ76320.1 class I SAM-dependent methyltransferase [Hymenobacter sp. 5516J-16]